MPGSPQDPELPSEIFQAPIPAANSGFWTKAAAYIHKVTKRTPGSRDGEKVAFQN
jgi:hypothetical protein